MDFHRAGRPSRSVIAWSIALLALGHWGCDDDPGTEDMGPTADASVDMAPDPADQAPSLDDGAPDAAQADGSPGDLGADPDAAPADAAPIDALVEDAAVVDAAPMDALLIDAEPDALPIDAEPDALPIDAEPDAEPIPDAAPFDVCGHPRSACRADADCLGGRCGSVPDQPDAPCICIGPRPMPVRAFCNGNGGPFEGGCCADADCAAPPSGIAVCQQEVYGPQNEYCGGAAPPEINACRADECEAPQDCPAAHVCIPAGAFGFVYSRCRPVSCHSDADCQGADGGECRPFFSRCTTSTFACTYETDPCREDADCPNGRFGPQNCVPQRGGGTACVENLPAP